MRERKHDKSSATAAAAAPPRQSAVETAAQALRSALFHGRLAPGHRLIEADLTADLGVSRGTLRSALARLSAEGLVQITAHRGAEVRRMTRRDVENLYQIRERLEGLAAGLAACRTAGGAPASALMRALASGRTDREADPASYASANQGFHQAVQDLAGNRQLSEILARLHLPLFRLQFRGFLRPRATSRSKSDHETIARAILEGRSAYAERVMRAHVKRSAAIILSLPDEFFG